MSLFSRNHRFRPEEPLLLEIAGPSGAVRRSGLSPGNCGNQTPVLGAEWSSFRELCPWNCTRQVTNVKAECDNYREDKEGASLKWKDKDKRNEAELKYKNRSQMRSSVYLLFKEEGSTVKDIEETNSSFREQAIS
ncbi:hypothetical protein CEXT_519381 [Caerostris extrusa]|uniref:Uncharacterized protein n=1 Tax=Caerostris extrusa TaxID=172846 RepID=A0AAV4VYT8_CAEEX|nr:hypothetical protein CEXT_519381 [Caerostris extrusa]